MAWTPPSGHIYVVGEVVTAATMNTYIEANLAFLYGDTAWTAATMTNSWVSFGGAFYAAAYRLFGAQVLLRGRIKSGTMGTAAFTLPVGYRPSGAQLYATVSPVTAGFSGAVQVDTTGAVIPTAGSNTDMSVNLQFDTLN